MLLYNFSIFAQSDVPLTLRGQFNGSYGYTIIGNTLNELDNWQIPVPPCQMLTESSATLNLLANQNVVAAYLYWGGIGNGTLNPQIQLNGVQYNSSETFVCDPEGVGTFVYFNSFVDISNQIINNGNGIYNFSNLNLNPIINGYCSNSIYNGGWHIVIVYNQLSLPNNQINIYDGNNVAFFAFNNGITPILVDNLNVIDNQNAKMTYVALNGSPNLFSSESITLNGNILSNSINPPDNPFNGTNSFTSSTTNWNQDIDTFDISPYISIGDTQANINMNSTFTRFIQTLVTSIRSELPDATIALTQVTGQNTCNNRTLQVNYTVQNTNSNANLPDNMPVSFYANNVLLSTVLTPSPIAIGGVLPVQAVVNVPAAVGSFFTLRVAVDNNAANLGTIAESNEANNSASLNIVLLEGNLVPAFSLANTFCQGGIVPALPTVSDNGVSGVWSPAVISNLSSRTYVFTPRGSCNVSFELDIDIITPQSVEENVAICNNVNNTAVNAVLLDTNLSTANYSFTWRKDNVLLANLSSSLRVVLPGVYLAIANEIATGCKQDFVFNVETQSPITANIVVPPDFSQNQIIAVVASGGTGNYSYSFDGFPFQPNASYAVTNSGQVSVVVKDDTNCAPFSKTIVLWQYPNFFTPNGDGYNDSWQIVTGKQIEVSIFNRYGKLLTQLRTNQGWNGTFKGQNVPADDYWFVINYDNGVFKGHFSLKR